MFCTRIHRRQLKEVPSVDNGERTCIPQCNRVHSKRTLLIIMRRNCHQLNNLNNRNSKRHKVLRATNNKTNSHHILEHYHHHQHLVRIQEQTIQRLRWTMMERLSIRYVGIFVENGSDLNRIYLTGWRSIYEHKIKSFCGHAAL